MIMIVKRELKREITSLLFFCFAKLKTIVKTKFNIFILAWKEWGNKIKLFKMFK